MCPYMPICAMLCVLYVLCAQCVSSRSQSGVDVVVIIDAIIVVIIVVMVVVCWLCNLLCAPLTQSLTQSLTHTHVRTLHHKY
mmetsp:Transcript_112908/g.221380  ORF Transcript_112908/g.221380 Transcript_112908/m.221380 type:complete len:82 (-) Transcript_112908:104-349(-)